MVALRNTTAVGDERGLALDEVLTLGTSALLGLNEELKQQQKAVALLREELNAAYRASAAAAAGDVEAARRSAEETEARVAKRERERESMLQSMQHTLDRGRREQQDLLHAVDRTAAHARLVEAKLSKAKQAATRILDALPGSAAEVALEAERLAKVAAGDAVHEEEDVDLLLSRALERAMRLAEKGQAQAAESTILRAEVDAERKRHESDQQHERALREELQAADQERHDLRRECAEAHEARDESENAARRFQALLFQCRQEAAQDKVAAQLSPTRSVSSAPPRSPTHPLSPNPFPVHAASSGWEHYADPFLNAQMGLQPPEPPAGFLFSAAPPLPSPTPSSMPLLTLGAPAVPPGAPSAAEAAVGSLEQAVRETAKITALLARD